MAIMSSNVMGRLGLDTPWATRDAGASAAINARKKANACLFMNFLSAQGDAPPPREGKVYTGEVNNIAVKAHTTS
jgi:hypothetical protein